MLSAVWNGTSRMKLATFEVRGATSYGMVQDDTILDAGEKLSSKYPDLRAVIAANALDELAAFASDSAQTLALNAVRLLKPIPNPGKIICVGVNYPERAAEYKDNPDATKYPSIFVRFPSSLVAHEEPIVRPPESPQLDYEGEVAVVIGRPGRRIPEKDALKHIAGYTICNEGTIRDWLRHGKFNVTPGKNFEKTGAIGPWIVTADTIGSKPMRIVTRVNAEVRQDDTTDRMIFPIPYLISYVSKFCTLEPGDILITGTPSGAGARFDPPRYLVPGDVVEVEVSGIGTLRNRIVDEQT
jgi:2-keto-4-pentenoate hydratase/2-oxohepta-3-ene-1,7-dioic acid hydratase in catechol pathway